MKFKVGDRIRVRADSKQRDANKAGVIVHITPRLKHPYEIEFDVGFWGCCHATYVLGEALCDDCEQRFIKQFTPAPPIKELD